MRKLIIVMLLGFLVCQVSAIPLQQAYNEATSGAGYDRMVYLDPAQTYTGGITITNEDVCIISSGALVDLQNASIIVESSATLDICGTCFINGDSVAIGYKNGADGIVDHCTFVRNYNCVYFDNGADMTFTSNIFANSPHFGVYCDEDAERWLAFNNAWQNTFGHYKEWCAT